MIVSSTYFPSFHNLPRGYTAFNVLCAVTNPKLVALPAKPHPTKLDVPSAIPTTPPKKFCPGKYPTSVPTKNPVAPPMAAERDLSVRPFSKVG